MFSNFTNALAQAAPWLSAVFIKSVFLLAIGSAATQLLKRSSASLRHFLHSATMAGLLILPVAALLLPELRLAVLPSVSPAALNAAPIRENNGVAPSARAPELNAQRPSPNEPHRAQEAAARSQLQPTSATAPQFRSELSKLNKPGVLVLLWICGFVLCLLRMAINAMRLRLLVSRALPVDAIALSSRLRWLCRDFGIRREVTVLASDEIDVPIAAGVLNPKIVLSPQSGEWSETRRHAVLCHELAHIKRLDGFTQFLGAMAAAIYWFNPLVWLALRAMRMERERACDDHVLAFGTPASDYAHELLEIVSTLHRPQPAAALAMARRSQLEGRVLALLNPRVRHSMLPRGAALLMCCAVFGIAFPLAAAKLQERPAPAAAKAGNTISTAPAADNIKPALASSDDQEPAAAPSAPAKPALAPAMPHEPLSAAGYPDSFEYHNNGDSQGSVSSPAPFECFDGKRAEHTNISSHSGDDGARTWTASWSGGECSIDAHSMGTVRFNAEATAIEGISSGGYFEINERKGDTLRRLRVEPAANGQLNFTYKLNGTQQEFDAGARAWFSSFLLALERATGFSASTRVPALLAKGGPPAVLAEIAQLQTDYVRQVYFAKLFENATLPAPLLVKALDQARNEISTDYSLAQVLLTIAEKYDLNDEAQRVAFLNGANKLHTDYEHSRVLIQLLKRPNLSPQVLRASLESAKSISTDYEKGRILTTLAGLSTFDESEISTYLDLASAIGTDYEHSRVLMALMEHHKLSPAGVSRILASASSISTDYEKSRILMAVNGSTNFDEKQIATYLTLVDSIGTDYERSRDLIALMQQHKLANDSVARILDETRKIGTDHEKARVLTEAAGHYEMQGKLRDAYIKAADSIGTEYDRDRTLAAITKREMM